MFTLKSKEISQIFNDKNILVLEDLINLIKTQRNNTDIRFLISLFYNIKYRNILQSIWQYNFKLSTKVDNLNHPTILIQDKTPNLYYVYYIYIHLLDIHKNLIEAYDEEKSKNTKYYGTVVYLQNRVIKIDNDISKCHKLTNRIIFEKFYPKINIFLKKYDKNLSNLKGKTSVPSLSPIYRDLANALYRSSNINSGNLFTLNELYKMQLSLFDTVMTSVASIKPDSMDSVTFKNLMD